VINNFVQQLKSNNLLGKIIDQEKFLEEHRHRVLNNDPKISYPYLKRLEEYCFNKGLKLCNQCYRTYHEEKNCTECSQAAQ